MPKKKKFLAGGKFPDSSYQKYKMEKRR